MKRGDQKARATIREQRIVEKPPAPSPAIPAPPPGRPVREVESGDLPLTAATMRRLLRQTVYFATLVGMVIWFLFNVRHILPLFLFAFILAYLLSAPVEWVAGITGRRGFPRSAAILIVY